ncbi:YegP family protein [Lysobacter sp. K5869]|uniref:YegP family protein n=1 Tax=Lysobacter sp. K5869 TaxID=2820808 RepID=UPI001C0648F8|nr:YegP family protein [Lysobacter sp. K5869]QWP75071.1 YegP family protein [Lysobacter sp. K5869]
MDASTTLSLGQHRGINMAGELRLEIYREGIKAGEEAGLARFISAQSPTFGQWRWRIKGRNGEPVANGGESYHNKADMLAILEKIVNLRVVDAHVVDG